MLFIRLYWSSYWGFTWSLTVSFMVRQSYPGWNYRHISQGPLANELRMTNMFHSAYFMRYVLSVCRKMPSDAKKKREAKKKAAAKSKDNKKKTDAPETNGATNGETVNGAAVNGESLQSQKQGSEYIPRVYKLMNHFANAPSQWEKTLHCNVISYCLGAYHRFSQKWQLRVCTLNFRVCKMALLKKIPMKMNELG